MTKRIKISIDEIVRVNRLAEVKEIKNVLRQKYVQKAIDDSEVVTIQVFPSSYTEAFTIGGWSAEHKGDNVVIRLKDCVGSIQEYDIEKLIKERKLKEKKKEVELYDNTIAQAKLLFLTGEYKDFECAFNFIENRINYERKKTGHFSAELSLNRAEPI